MYKSEEKVATTIAATEGKKIFILTEVLTREARHTHEQRESCKTLLMCIHNSLRSVNLNVATFNM